MTIAFVVVFTPCYMNFWRALQLFLPFYLLHYFVFCAWYYVFPYWMNDPLYFRDVKIYKFVVARVESGQGVWLSCCCRPSSPSWFTACPTLTHPNPSALADPRVKEDDAVRTIAHEFQCRNKLRAARDCCEISRRISIVLQLRWNEQLLYIFQHKCKCEGEGDWGY